LEGGKLMRAVGGRRAVALAAMALCAYVPIGCGDDSGGATETTGLNSEPARLVAQMARTTATANKAKDCKPVFEVNRRSPGKLICPPISEDMRKLTRGTKLTKAATYGAAAVVDYRSPGAKGGASVVLYRNPENQWIIGRWGLVYGPTVGTDDGSARDETRKAVDRYLDAVRRRDCEAFNKYAVTQANDPAEVCKTEFKPTARLAKALKSSPRPELEYIGGNEDLAFYKLVLGSDGTYTVSTVATPEGSLRPHVVLGVSPAPTSG
jgi:hypothetical protein